MAETAARSLTVKEWEQRTEWPLAAVAVGFLIAYAVPILSPGARPALVHWCEVVAIVSWIAFALDYLIRVRLATSRWRYVRRHVLDLAVIALPLLRPLRLLRVVAILAVLNRGVSGGLRGRVAVYVIGASLMTIFVGGLAVLDAERASPIANIRTPGDAWW
ncbi:hypothetical protein ACWEOW_12910 [Monashia sp. NPDC004114]